MESEIARIHINLNPDTKTLLEKNKILFDFVDMTVTLGLPDQPTYTSLGSARLSRLHPESNLALQAINLSIDEEASKEASVNIKQAKNIGYRCIALTTGIAFGILVSSKVRQY